MHPYIAGLMRKKLMQRILEYVNWSIVQGILFSISVRLDKHSTDCFRNGNSLSIKDVFVNKIR